MPFPFCFLDLLWWKHICYNELFEFFCSHWQMHFKNTSPYKWFKDKCSLRLGRLYFVMILDPLQHKGELCCVCISLGVADARSLPFNFTGCSFPALRLLFLCKSIFCWVGPRLGQLLTFNPVPSRNRKSHRLNKPVRLCMGLYIMALGKQTSSQGWDPSPWLMFVESCTAHPWEENLDWFV